MKSLLTFTSKETVAFILFLYISAFLFLTKRLLLGSNVFSCIITENVTKYWYTQANTSFFNLLLQKVFFLIPFKHFHYRGAIVAGVVRRPSGGTLGRLISTVTDKLVTDRRILCGSPVTEISRGKGKCLHLMWSRYGGGMWRTLWMLKEEVET